MATLLSLKYEFEETRGKLLKFTFSGDSGAHLIAKDIALAGANDISTSPRPYPDVWEQRRM